MREQARIFGADTVLIEDCASGIKLLQELRGEGLGGLKEVKPKGDKVMRMQGQTARIEAGFVLFPNTAPWLDDYLHELMMFPHGTHDDQVDSTSQALGALFERTGIDWWLESERERRDAESVPAPMMRVNHDNAWMSFSLINGRMPIREADGSFLVTAAEFVPLRSLPGMRLQEDPR